VHQLANGPGAAAGHRGSPQALPLRRGPAYPANGTFLGCAAHFLLEISFHGRCTAARTGSHGGVRGSSSRQELLPCWVHPLSHTLLDVSSIPHPFGCTLQLLPFWVHPLSHTLLGAPSIPCLFGCTLYPLPFWVHPLAHTISGAPSSPYLFGCTLYPISFWVHPFGPHPFGCTL